MFARDNLMAQREQEFFCSGASAPQPWIQPQLSRCIFLCKFPDILLHIPRQHEVYSFSYHLQHN